MQWPDGKIQYQVKVREYLPNSLFFPAAAALRGVAIQTSRARAAFPTRTFARLPTPLTNPSAANTLHGYTP